MIIKYPSIITTVIVVMTVVGNMKKRLFCNNVSRRNERNYVRIHHTSVYPVQNGGKRYNLLTQGLSKLLNRYSLVNPSPSTLCTPKTLGFYYKSYKTVIWRFHLNSGGLGTVITVDDKQFTDGPMSRTRSMRDPIFSYSCLPRTL